MKLFAFVLLTFVLPFSNSEKKSDEYFARGQHELQWLTFSSDSTFTLTESFKPMNCYSFTDYNGTYQIKNDTFIFQLSPAIPPFSNSKDTIHYQPEYFVGDKDKLLRVSSEQFMDRKFKKEDLNE